MLLVTAAIAQEPRGRILELKAGGDAQASAVEIVGDRPLSFTTLKLAGPPRVVVDFADTELVAPERELSIDDGTVKRAAAATAGARTARVVIELAAEAEFDVRAVGNSVEVRVPRPAPLVAQAEPAPQPQAAPAAPPQPEQKTEPQPETEAQVRASLPKVALVGSRPAANVPPPPAAPLAAAPADVARKPERAAPAKKASDDRRLAAAEAHKSKPERKARAPQRKVAMAAEPKPRHSITGIGFRPQNGGEVIVRSDHPLEYGVSGEGNAVLLHLPGAGIPLPNNRRPLDTQFFGGPVQRIVPVAVAGGTDVRIEVKGHTDYQLQQSGSVLTVTFSPQQ